MGSEEGARCKEHLPLGRSQEPLPGVDASEVNEAGLEGIAEQEESVLLGKG
jgi:hypothetical protein